MPPSPSFKESDADLALFNELQGKEKDNFLLESNDDFEDLLSSKTKPFSDFKLGINVHVRGGSSDLLDADMDKNDYEWLITPPETPLFQSLDDEPAPVNLVHSGRSRSRPITISRSSTMDKRNRSSRGSPSPQRLSPSPRFHGRPSSAPRSTPAPSHSYSPSRRPSPPQVKPSTSSRTSPVRMSRGNSTSPKVKAWQSNIPGFSLEAPPNLRTSLADRPASYVRGSSPASKGRKSMSPTPSRSISSSHGKSSIASSGDDDADSLHSSFCERPSFRKGVSGYPSGRPLGFSKKSTKTFSPSSAPKRLFDSSMRQMDRKTPPNMFRPLLSSVPSSTFYSGKPNTTHHALISRNSSVTTSSNTSSDLTTNALVDTEESDRQYHDDMANDCVNATFSDNHDEVFEFGKINTEHGENHDVSSEPVQLDINGDVDIINSNGNTLVCSICGSRYSPDDLDENEGNICFECKQNKLSSLHELDVSEIAQNQGCALESPHDDIQHIQNNPRKSLSDSIKSVNLDNDSSDLNIDVSNGAGISVLLKRSSSVKGNFVHGRTINGSAVSFEDLSYAKDLTGSLRSSLGYGSFSASSSVDLSSTRHEMFVRRQLSCRLSDSNSKPQSTVSSFSATSTSMPVYQSSIDGSISSPLDQVLTPSVLEKEGIMLEKGVPEVDDVVEDSVECSLSTMSEIEVNESHPSSPRSQIDTVIIRDDLEDSSTVIMDRDTDIKDVSQESDHADQIIEESTVTMEDKGGKKTKSLTLEEATDTILFCNSIIHDLVYKAANLAIEKEKENLEPFQVSKPTITIPDKSSFNKNNSRGFSSSKALKSQKKQAVEPEVKPPLTQNGENSNEPVVRDVGVSKNRNFKNHPPKLDSKCNCTIM